LWAVVFVVEVVVVLEDELVVGGVAAAGVELEEAELPPHAANATAATIMLNSALFIDPTPFSLGNVQLSGYKTPPAPKRCGGRNGCKHTPLRPVRQRRRGAERTLLFPVRRGVRVR
jgi:hypothetical protein